jgi:hypothetical protein
VNDVISEDDFERMVERPLYQNGAGISYREVISMPIDFADFIHLVNSTPKRPTP